MWFAFCSSVACEHETTSAHCCSCCWRHWTSSGGHASIFGLSKAHVVSPTEDVRGESFAQACLLMIQCGPQSVQITPTSYACIHCMYTLHVDSLVYVLCHGGSECWASPALLGHYTNKPSSSTGLTGKAHSVTVSIPTMFLPLVQVRQICGCSIDKAMQNRGQLLVSLAEQLAQHADTAEARGALDATLTALQCLEPTPVYRVEVRSLATCLQCLLWVTAQPMQLHR